ncbi:VTT domain-containing protein [Marinilongibacter aquaticus]|uniref:TVP38/TMEM64 family protein n=1 Tax=Marinilongibacter aquaticus TaxID=2975157 RepID=UPI0021BDACCE|nr:VTT domain-containing protein [Marinilongibacter aquaticus]UBM57391.1 VTT domain-containing protein [Marinilongibacter aquaticus]
MKRAFRKYLSIPVISSLVLIAVPLIATSFLSVYFVQNEAHFSAYNTYEWLLFSLLGIFSQAFALTPPTFCALVLGYFWGWKTLPVLFVINIASIYLVNRIVLAFDHRRFRQYVEENPKAKKLLQSIRTDELKIITLTKLSPVMPFTFTNLVFTLSGAKLKNILLGGFLGMIPRTLLSLWTGTQAKEIRKLLNNPNSGNLEQITVILLIFVSVIGLFWVINRAIKRSTNGKDL